MKRIILIALTACATTGASGEGDRDLPTSGVGPFRKLDVEEVKGIAPFVLDDDKAGYREPAALQEGEETLLFVVGAKDGRDVIFRSRALDGRTFYGTAGHFGVKPPVVLEPDAAPSWENGALSGPALVRGPSGELLLYYAAAGGIGVARSADGFTFTKEPSNPILKREAAWEIEEVRAPSVVRMPSGRFKMFYSAGNAIGEAESDDGIHFRRAGDRPVLEPAPPPAPGSLLPNEKPPFDTASVGDPCASPRMTPADRLQVRVLYTGRDASGASTIGFAARYGEDGPLVRQSSGSSGLPVAVYAVGQKEVAPAFVERPEGSYLYVEQERRDGTRIYRAIAGAFAPGNIKLPAPADFPESP